MSSGSTSPTCPYGGKSRVSSSSGEDMITPAARFETYLLSKYSQPNTSQIITNPTRRKAKNR